MFIAQTLKIKASYLGTYVKYWSILTMAHVTMIIRCDDLKIIFILLLITESGCNETRDNVTRLGDFWKFFATNSLSKVAQKDCWLVGYLENNQLM